MDLGRIGIWAGGAWRDDDRAAESADVAAELEQLGFSALWLSGGQRPGFTPRYRMLLDATSRMAVASGIVSIWRASPQEVTRGAAELEAAHPDRFLLGLGVSHATPVEASGQSYTRPYSRMVTYLNELDSGAPAVPSQRRILAALGPRMLALAAARTAGAHPYFVPVEHTVGAREVLGTGPLLAPEQAVVLETDPARARRIARQHARLYLQAPNYINNLRRLGYGDDDLAGEGSDRLVDAVVAWGDTAAVERRLDEHFQAGADHVCLQVLTGSGDFPRAEYRALAEALLAS